MVEISFSIRFDGCFGLVEELSRNRFLHKTFSAGFAHIGRHPFFFPEITIPLKHDGNLSWLSVTLLTNHTFQGFLFLKLASHFAGLGT